MLLVEHPATGQESLAEGARVVMVSRLLEVIGTSEKNLKLQYYHAQLEDYYNQNFFGLIHSLDIGVGRSLTTDLRYFKSDSDGKNGTDSRYAMRTGYNENGKIDNKTWSLAFTYKDGGHALTLGHQQVSDKSGFATVNSSNVVDGRGRPEGEGGVQSLYLYTDVMVNSFIRAGENSTFGIYSYDFAALGVPGLKAGWTYVSGKDIRVRVIRRQVDTVNGKVTTV